MPYYEITLTVEDQVRARKFLPVGQSFHGVNLWGDGLEVTYHEGDPPDEGDQRLDVPQGAESAS